MAKAPVNKSTNKARNATSNKSASSSTISSNGHRVTSVRDNAGVVAYTKGSRLKDSAVRDAVRRVLKGE